MIHDKSKMIKTKNQDDAPTDKQRAEALARAYEFILSLDMPQEETNIPISVTPHQELNTTGKMSE